MQSRGKKERRILSLEGILKLQDFFYLHLSLLILSLFFLVFYLVLNPFNDTVFFIMLLIPIGAGWLLGMRGGVVFGMICALTAVLFGFEATFFTYDTPSVWVTSSIIMIALGLGVGRLRDLNNRSNQNTQDLKKIKGENIKLQSQLKQARKMESIGVLSGGIAHDFNNILAAIMGHVEIAQFNTPPDHPLRQNLSQILQATYRAKDLVQQILTYTRQSDAQMQPVQFNQVVKEVSRLLRASLPSTITIHSDIELGEGVILADPTQIHQILMNLCANASHSMGENGGELDIHLSNLTLRPEDVGTINGLPPGQYLKLTVRDTGHGIDPAFIDSIFDPYFTTKEEGKGTGMGLTMVNDIVKNHNGAITVSSEVEKGTTFDLYFPRIEAVMAPEVKAPEHAPTGTERILFVDDEKELVDMVKRILEQLGYHTVARTDAIAALDTFRSVPNNFDLVITDMTMPNMTGDILSKEIKRIRPDIPIILCSGFSPLINKEKAKNLGIKDFLMKPLAINDLAKAIRDVLDS